MLKAAKEGMMEQERTLHQVQTLCWSLLVFVSVLYFQVENVNIVVEELGQTSVYCKVYNYTGAVLNTII